MRRPCRHANWQRADFGRRWLALNDLNRSGMSASMLLLAVAAVFRGRPGCTEQCRLRLWQELGVEPGEDGGQRSAVEAVAASGGCNVCLCLLACYQHRCQRCLAVI